MTIPPKANSQRFFRIADKIFWVIWVLLPVTFGLLLYTLLQPETFTQGLTPEQIRCMGDKLSISQGSAATMTVFWILFSYEFGFYVVLFAILHRMIRRFIRGSIFVGETLASVERLGWLILAFPIVSTLLSNACNMVLVALGQPTYGKIVWIVDIGPIAVGLFLVALKHVLHHAIQLKSENDLTI